tara:strand:- start:1039 stop:1362 length:324 start_codon:yes stop_codon:yes gene_type:complete
VKLNEGRVEQGLAMNETSASVDAVDLADKLVDLGEKERAVIHNIFNIFCTVLGNNLTLPPTGSPTGEHEQHEWYCYYVSFCYTKNSIYKKCKNNGQTLQASSLSGGY